MNWVAWKMLNGDTAKYLGAVFGVAFGVLLITQQASIFVGLMSRGRAEAESQWRHAERVDARVLQVLFEIVDDTAAVSPTDGTPGRDLFVGQQLDVQIDAAAR